MQNPTVLNPDVVIAMAQHHQRSLLAQARNDRLVSGLSGKPSLTAGVRNALGALMVRAGTRVAVQEPAPTLVRQPAI